MPVRKLLLAISFLVLGAGCHTSGPATRPDTASRDPYLILANELEGSNRDNLYDAVRQLRPGWFTRVTRQRNSEESIVVYLADRQIGPAETLRNFPTRAVAAVRYLSPTEAQVRYGQTNLGRPAIQVELERAP